MQLKAVTKVNFNVKFVFDIHYGEKLPLPSV